MIETIKKLKEQRPDLVKLFEKMSKSQLLNQLYLEVIDAINMESRVELFMRECSGLSKTNYTLESLQSIIADYKQRETSMFCEMALEDIDEMSIEEIKEYLRNETI